MFIFVGVAVVVVAVVVARGEEGSSTAVTAEVSLGPVKPAQLVAAVAGAVLPDLAVVIVVLVVVLLLLLLLPILDRNREA